jgi:hypothetical protein
VGNRRKKQEEDVEEQEEAPNVTEYIMRRLEFY